MREQLNYDMQNEFYFEEANYELQSKLKSIIFKHDYMISVYQKMQGMEEMIEKYERDKMAFIAILEFMKGNKTLLNSYPSIKEI